MASVRANGASPLSIDRQRAAAERERESEECGVCGEKEEVASASPRVLQRMRVSTVALGRLCAHVGGAERGRGAAFVAAGVPRQLGRQEWENEGSVDGRCSDD